MTATKKNLGDAESVSTMLRTNSIIVEIDGSTRRITLEDFTNSIQTGSLNLSQYAWAIPIKQDVQSSSTWGRIGSTEMWEQYRSQVGRYLLTSAGKKAKISNANSTIFADGTAVDESKGNVVVCGPRLYYLVKSDAVTGIPYLWMSSLPIGGHYIESPVIGAYKGYVLNGQLLSRSGYAPTGAQTISQFWNYARKNGTNYGLADYEARIYMQMLNLSEFGNPNVQTNIGYGIGGSEGKDLWATAYTLLTGATTSLGDSCGKIDIDVINGSNTGVNCSRVSLFGIEDAWNWQHEMTQGIYFGKSENTGQSGKEVFIYEGNRMPNTAELATKPSGNYRQLERIDTEGYVSKMILGEYFDLIASSTNGGNSNSYWCDCNYRNTTTGQLCLFGGNAAYGSNSGLAYVNSSNAFSAAAANCGARLAYYGETETVNGADL